MKYRNNFKYTLSAALLLCLLLGMGSCIREELVGGVDTNDYSSVAIRVKMPEQTVVNPTTRAEAAEFDKLADMNIFISDEGIIRKRIYLDFIANTWGDGTQIVDGTENNDGVTVTVTETNGYKEFHLTFSDTYLDGISVKSCQFHAVANWGKAITESEDEGTVRRLQTLEARVETADLGSSGSHDVVPTPNIMYGEIISERSEVIDPAKPAEVRRVVTVGLKRTAAMIILVMDGSGLNDNVVIELQDVTLRNVPQSCTLGPDNKVNHAKIGSYGDFRGGMMLANGYKLIGKGRFGTSGYTEADGYRTSIGAHYTENADGTVTDVSNELVRPLFLFENMQGTGEPVTDANQAHKRPSGVADSKEAISQYNDGDDAVCSYIEVNAIYTRYNGSSIYNRGFATWRFFLGGNVTNDFNVERNTNYRLTLKLSGTGISEAESSWRVDVDLKEPEVVGDPDMVVGGGGEMFCVELTDQAAGNQNMKLISEGADFVYAYAFLDGSGKNGEWMQISKAGNKAYKWHTTGGTQMWFYVQPLLPEDPYQGDERTCNIWFASPGSNKEDAFASVSFTQYRPVTFSITPADLKDYRNDEDLQRAYEIIKTYYNHDVETQGEFKFYADRVDRDPMPWGFSGIQLDKNQNTGFENVYHLIKPLEGNLTGTCPSHVEHARHYLPTGKGFREDLSANVNNAYIDYSKGSCMMHAAMENYFQQYYPKPDNTVKPDDLIGVKLEDVHRPGSSDDQTEEARRYSWCVPSIAGYQLVEKLDRFYKRQGINDRGFDPNYPISKWTSYWTSNSATANLKDDYPNLVPGIDGKNRSFIYQFDMGLDKIKEDDLYPSRLLMPRASSIKYRFLTIRPDDLSSGGTTK